MPIYNATTKTFTVSTADQLNQAIADIDAIGRGGQLAAGNYTIQLTQTIDITAGSNGNAITDADGTSPLMVNGHTVLSSNELKALNLVNGVTASIDGEGYALDGGNTTRGLFVYQGQVAISDLTIQNAAAIGGNGSGGGAGLGGGLFIAGENPIGQTSGGSVTLSDVTFLHDVAEGGSGDGNIDYGGGGLGGNGGYGTGGGGGVGASGNSSLQKSAPAGIIVGALGGGTGAGITGHPGSAGGNSGGAGGPGTGGGGVEGGPANSTSAGFGGFGGGGGGDAPGVGGSGGFGGGGGGGFSYAGNGGFGGGGASSHQLGGIGGFGGGNGIKGTVFSSGTGGGGLGAGGSIFVQAGGNLTIEGALSISDGSVAAGTGNDGNDVDADGQAFASGIYIQGAGNTLDFDTTNPITNTAADQTVSDVIGDDTGSAAAANYAGQSGPTFNAPDYTMGRVGINVTGTGTLILSAANTYAGVTTIASGTLQLGAGGTGGSIVYTSAIVDDGTLAFDHSNSQLENALISGTGGLMQIGSGLTVLTGAETYTGTTTITQGQLQIGNNTADSSIADSSNIVDDGELVFARSDVETETALISGTGALLQFRLGTTILTNANTYTGRTTIAQGTLQLGNGGTDSAINDSSGIVDNATLAIDHADAESLTPAISGTGALVLSGPGTTTIATQNTYSGGTTIAAGTLDLAVEDTTSNGTLVSAAAGTGAITFDGGGGHATLALDTTAQPGNFTFFGNTLDDFGAGDALDLKGLAFSSGVFNGAFFNPVNDELSVTEDGVTELFTLGSPGAAAYSAQSDGDGGTLISAIACYARGTRILTSDGEVAVEALRIGMHVQTAGGALRVIRWIGCRSYAGRCLAVNPGVHPIRFRADSLGAGLPRRDLLVSPGHAMFLDGLLIPARCLVNGATIVQEHALTEISYFHVELASHDVLLAEGAPSESFMDDDNRGVFHNARQFAQLYPDGARSDGLCAPRVEGGYEVEVIRRRLAPATRAVEEAA